MIIRRDKILCSYKTVRACVWVFIIIIILRHTGCNSLWDQITGLCGCSIRHIIRKQYEVRGNITRVTCHTHDWFVLKKIFNCRFLKQKKTYWDFIVNVYFRLKMRKRNINYIRTVFPILERCNILPEYCICLFSGNYYCYYFLFCKPTSRA